MIVKDKVIVVSGAGPGLGRETARLALRDGARVVLGARNLERIETLARELDPGGERVAAFALDLDDEASIAEFAAGAEARFGQVDAVVQVAANHVFGELDDTTSEGWAASYRTNVIGSVELVRHFAPGMRRRNRGSFVFVGSQAALRPTIPEVAYAATKGALISSTFYLAKDLGRSGIRVNNVLPSWMWGPVLEGFVDAQASAQGTTRESVIEGIASQLPLGEIPPDEDVAETILFLCSDRSRMITGQSILVNGGDLMR